MIPYRILGGTFSGNLGHPNQPDSFMDATLTVEVTVHGQLHQVPVRAKLVIGSKLVDRDVEVYAPNWPAGANIQADQLQKVVRSYLFAFLNTAEVANLQA